MLTGQINYLINIFITKNQQTMKKTKKIEQEVLELSDILIEPWECYNSEETDSLLEDYTRKYDEFINNELDYYFMLI